MEQLALAFGGRGGARPGAGRPRIERALRAVRRREGFRVVHFSVQHDHLHLVVEADDRRRLSNGMRALLGRIAVRINRVMGTRGPRFADRYHEVELRSPQQVHNTLRYVLANRAHHVDRTVKLDWALVRDQRSSAVVVDAVSTPTSWVLRVGWVQAAAPPS